MDQQNVGKIEEKSWKNNRPFFNKPTFYKLI